MGQKNLHELLKEDQEPFQLQSYIADRRCQLKRPSKNSLQAVKKTKTSTLTKHVCFFSFQDSPDVRKSPLSFPSHKSPTKKVFLHVPTTTSSLLLEAATRIQKSQVSKPNNKVGFGLFGSILKKLKDRDRNRDKKITESRTSCSCNHSGLSSSAWSDRSNCETSSSESTEEIIINGDFGLCDNKNQTKTNTKYCSSPLSPFRFSLQRSPSSTGRRTPDLSSPTASPTEDKVNYEGTNIEHEEEEKEQCSPVSVLDPPFDDERNEDEDEDEDEDEEDDDSDLDYNYAIVQRAQQQLLYKLRRFEKLAELDPIELEKLMLEEEEEDDMYEFEEEDCEGDDNSVLSFKDTIPFDMKRLVSDLISEEKTEANKEEVVFGRVCKRLDSWQYVRSDTINMMVESDLRTEFDDWKKFQEQREEIAKEFEVSIFRLLVEELAEDLA